MALFNFISTSSTPPHSILWCDNDYTFRERLVLRSLINYYMARRYSDNTVKFENGTEMLYSDFHEAISTFCNWRKKFDADTAPWLLDALKNSLIWKFQIYAPKKRWKLFLQPAEE